MQQRTWRRRNYFVGKDFQGRFILRFFLTILIGAVIFTAILSIFSAHTLTVTYEDSYLRLDRTPKALLLQIVRAYGVYIVLLGVAISVVSLFVSHRIAGPLFRLERSVEEITKGDLSFRITLRKKDELKELAALMNTMLDTLSGRLKEARSYADAAQSEMTVLSGQVREIGGASKEMGERISGAMDSIENLKKALSYFILDKN